MAGLCLSIKHPVGRTSSNRRPSVFEGIPSLTGSVAPGGERVEFKIIFEEMYVDIEPNDLWHSSLSELVDISEVEVCDVELSDA